MEQTAPRALSEQNSSLLMHALSDRERRVLPESGARRAAVLILLYERDGEPWVVLTKRSETVRLHKGEVCFPGGSADPEDRDLWGTAVRETIEELGVDPTRLRVLGALDDYSTFSTGYIVSPFVAALDPPLAWNPSAHEIAAVLEVPLRELAALGRVEDWERHGMRLAMHIFDTGGHRIWGVTAFILRHFLDIVWPALGYDQEENHAHR